MMTIPRHKYGLNKMTNINLFKYMQKLVDDNVVSYKTDFDIDKSYLLNKDVECNTFYWYLRESGTNIMRDDLVNKKGTFDNDVAIYYESIAKQCYKITITKRGLKYIYGDIERVNIREFVDNVKKNTK